MTEGQLRVLVIDDELPMRRMLRVALESYDYTVAEAADGKEGLVQAAMQQPDLILLDLGLPDLDGKEIVHRLREWTKAPIVILSARDQEQEKIEVLDAGADDYLTKPFGMGELLARMRVSLRRSGREDNGPALVCGALCMDVASHTITLQGEELHLTPTEYTLLKVLIQNTGKVMNHKQLLKQVWGDAYSQDTHYVRVYIAQLRRKIEANPLRPQYIITESGVGYRFTDPRA